MDYGCQCGQHTKITRFFFTFIGRHQPKLSLPNQNENKNRSNIFYEEALLGSVIMNKARVKSNFVQFFWKWFSVYFLKILVEWNYGQPEWTFQNLWLLWILSSFVWMLLTSQYIIYVSRKPWLAHVWSNQYIIK